MRQRGDGTRATQASLRGRRVMIKYLPVKGMGTRATQASPPHTALPFKCRFFGLIGLTSHWRNAQTDIFPIGFTGCFTSNFSKKPTLESTALPPPLRVIGRYGKGGTRATQASPPHIDHHPRPYG